MNNYWERISARLNVDYKVNNSVTVGTRIYLARLRGNPYTESFPWVSIPYMNVYDEDGGYAAVPSGIDFDGSNPVAVIALQHQKQSDLLANADLFVDWEIVKGLKLNLTDRPSWAAATTTTIPSPTTSAVRPRRTATPRRSITTSSTPSRPRSPMPASSDATISRRCSAGRPRTPISPT